MALPAVVLLLLTVLLAGSLGVAQVRVQDAARSAGRAVSLGEPVAAAAAMAQDIAGPGAQVRLSRAGEWVEVAVTRDVTLLRLGSIRVHAEARALAEPTGSGP